MDDTLFLETYSVKNYLIKTDDGVLVTNPVEMMHIYFVFGHLARCCDDETAYYCYGKPETRFFHINFLYVPYIDFIVVCFCISHLMIDGPQRARLLPISPTAIITLPSCLWSLRTFPSLPGSHLTIFYRDASPALFLQLVNQWLNFT